MSLLKLLGIDKYTERLKLWVNNKLDSIKTPDWMAGQNEDGYIKNKTHGLLEVSPLMNNGDTATVDISSAIIYSPLVGTRYTTINSGETKTIVYLGDDSSVTVTFSGNTITLNDPASFLQEPIYVAWGAEQLDDVFIPQTISRIPNWNAQPGEPGYIENKPFEKIIFDGVIKSDNTIEYKYNISTSSVYISYEDKELLHFINGGDVEATLDEPNIKVYWNEMDQVFITNLSDAPIESIKHCISVYAYEYDIRLPSSSIDDGVIKTFPQTLSDTDKNQALDNLGIDPVVWKYICRPLPINDQDNCPEELLDERGNLKYQIPSMYIVHHGGEYCGPVSWIGERYMTTFYNNGSYFEVNLDDSGVFTITELTV